MKTNSLVSVIIPTYKRPEWLECAIESIKHQDYSNIEIIVIDDNSWEYTKEVAQKFPDVIFLRNESNMGCGYSRKRGLSIAKGKYIVFIDDDDYYTDATFFEKAVNIMEKNEDTVAVFAGSTSINMDTREEKYNTFMKEGFIDAREYLKGYNITFPTPFEFGALMKKEHLIQVGVGEMAMLNHMPMHMRCLISGRVYCIHDSVGMYREHNNNISKQMTADFILKNLGEKLEIYNIIKEKKLFDDYLFWWHQQVEITVGYYVYKSSPILREFKKIKKWCVAHSDGNKNIIKLMETYKKHLKGESIILKIKRKIKKILRKK